MNEFLKKGFLLGLGAAIAGKEKLEEKLDELVEKNELTTEQARNVMNDFIEKGTEKKSEWSTARDQAGLATKEDIEELQMRLTNLENKLADK